MKVSIIIPIYNVESYVKRCLESVMAQDRVEADMECVIVDDCGQDHSMEVVRQTVGGYQGPISFVIVEHEKNRGLSAARNTGLSKATGDYVMFVDSDDYLQPDSISYFLDNLKHYPGVDIMVGNVISPSASECMMSQIKEPMLINTPGTFFRQLLYHQIYLYAWNKLIRREVLVAHQILFEEGVFYEDQLWSYLLSYNIQSVLVLPRVTYVYENNPGSIVNTTLTPVKAPKVVESYLLMSNRILDNPPDSERNHCCVTVDYLLFVGQILMNASDVLPYVGGKSDNIKQFRLTRGRLMQCTLSEKRMLLAAFFMLLYSPWSNLKRWAWFRHHYHHFEQIVGKISHLTDFMHRI